MGSCSEQLTEQQCQLTERQARVDARGKLLGHSEFQLAHSKFQKPSETPQEVSRPLNTSLGGVLRHILSEIPRRNKPSAESSQRQMTLSGLAKNSGEDGHPDGVRAVKMHPLESSILYVFPHNNLLPSLSPVGRWKQIKASSSVGWRSSGWPWETAGPRANAAPKGEGLQGASVFQNVPSWPLGVCGKGRETKVHIRREQFFLDLRG